MEEKNFIPIIGTDRETGKKTLCMENNDTITFDILEEGDYTLSFEGSYLVNAAGYISYILNMIKDGVETYIDEFNNRIYIYIRYKKNSFIWTFPSKF